MAVPDFQSFFKPLLDIAADGKEHSMKEAREIIAKRMNIAEADLRELLPSGTQTKYDNRIAWAKSYFVQANVFESPRRGWFHITERGKELHKKGHDRIDVKILNQFPEFVEFHTVIKKIKGPSSGEIEIPGGISAFFVPGRSNHLKGKAENKRVSCYIGFSYDGLRAWSVKDI